MGFAYPMQKLQDWITQQWVIFRGRKIEPAHYPWLIGPFGNLDAVGGDFIHRFAEKENLVIEKDAPVKGIIPSMASLNLPDEEMSRLSREVIGFYESTNSYDLDFSVQWNSFFKFFGLLLNRLFSKRLNQLNIPTESIPDAESIKSEIINLVDPQTNQIKHTFWFRALESTGQVIYSGVYGICQLPSGKTCVKAVFPLPNGNATVIMNPAVGENGELILDSSGNKFGDAGFYFLLKDARGKYHAQFIRSFRDRLVIGSREKLISAEQTLTLWNRKVLQFNYEIRRHTKHKLL
ncbi:hypothetical protein [Niabella hibiscisoli]|uniref:hypothetical protein n=1 Tax=Niabella hibiscisoli TaxID=1825928 RepID=UPI001F10CE68|nr:hypothetical protein [Niabella hibiscisoli]MCH5719988.1 hypothetical protein [Niabella hibiscisoli]